MTNQALTTYGLNGMVEQHLDKVLNSAKKRNLTVFYARRLCRSQASGRQYYSTVIVAVEDGKPMQYASVNRKGAVSWYSIQDYYRPTYELTIAVQVAL